MAMNMKKVSARDFQSHIGKYQDMAMSEPITITKHDRPTLVLLSFEDYQKLTGRSQRALHVTELSQDDLDAILQSSVPEKFKHLDEEID